MSVRRATIIASMASAGMLAGCAGDNSNLLTTASVSQPAPIAAKPVVSAECVTLSSRITSLRQEGTPDRIKKVAAGKSATANVKRSALAKLSELDAANLAFQQKCSTLIPAQQPAVTAQSAAATATKAVATAKNVTTVAKTAAAVGAAPKAVSAVAQKADRALTAAEQAKAAAAAVKTVAQ